MAALVTVVALEPIRHERKRYAVGDTIRMAEGHAQALIDMGHAEAVDTKKAKADAEAKAKADAEAGGAGSGQGSMS